jgi:hypothetical protein
VYFSSSAPWISAAVGVMTLSPHLLWLYQNHFTTVTYGTIVHVGGSFGGDVLSAITYLTACILCVAGPAAIIFAASRPSRAALYDIIFPPTLDRRLVAVIFWTPLLLPIAMAILGNIHPVALWAVPALTLLPVILLGSPVLKLTSESCIRITRFALVFPVLALLAAPLIALDVFLNANGNISSPHSRLLSAVAQRVWRSETEKPLTLIIGDRASAIGIAFYSPDHPIVNPRDSMSDQFGKIPRLNLNSEDIQRSGLIAVCKATVSQCTELLHALAPSVSPGRVEEVTLARRFLLWTGRPLTYVIIAVPPVS